MRQNDDGKTVAAMDILFPGIGEIVGGSQREERLDKLTERTVSYTHLFSTRKRSCSDCRSVPHFSTGNLNLPFLLGVEF